jgi:signal transduction histidine kinase
MKTERSPWTASHQAWLILAVRILFLAALLLAAAYSDRLTDDLILLLALWMAITLLNSVGRMIGWQPPMAEWVTSTLDIAFALATIAFTGYFESPLWWSILIGSITIGVSYGILRVVFFTGVQLLLAIGMSILVAPVDPLPVFPGLLRAAIILLSAMFLSSMGDLILQKMDQIEQDAASKSSQIQEQERLRSQAFYRLAADLSSSLNPDDVLEKTLDLSTDALSREGGQDDRLTSALLIKDGEDLRLASARGLPPSDLRLRLPLADSVLADVLASGESKILSHAERQHSLLEVSGLQECGSIMAVPLSTDGQAFGLYLFGYRDAHFFQAEQLGLMDAIAKQAMIAYRNARLYQDLELEKERITEIQDEARKKLARDLHDGPTQTIAAITMRVNYAQRLIEREPGDAIAELMKVEDMARSTTKEIRHMLFTLRPLILETQGLATALYQLAEKMRETHGQNVIVEADFAQPANLDMGTQGVIFYIAEEAVNNARKHGEAEHIWVRLRQEDEQFTLEVEDDGVGFNVGAVDATYAQRGSLGIVNMRERADLVDGTLRIESSEGGGTRIHLQVPAHTAEPDPAAVENDELPQDAGPTTNAG